MAEPSESRFWKTAQQSELIEPEALQACLESIPPEKRAPDQLDRRLARQAVQGGHLTLWQAQQLLAGRSSGFKINRYTLLDLIGQGGMGRVYLARDTRLNRRVAIKILSPERVNNPRAIARFQREARVGAQLQHENLVRIYDEGEANGKCYIVMEFIEGKNIGTLIAENGPMSPGVAARLTRQVALGLEHAQQKGLIHRDVNPYNILVTQDGNAKLTDLGLAIDLSDQAPVTRDGATVGTFDYVSPEQARHSHSVDTRSDIYSLGCTIYHMLTGQVPFPSPSLPEKLFGHQAVEPEPVETLVPTVPEALGEVVRKMMRKSPDDRYASPRELAQALEPFVDGLEVGSRDDAAQARPAVMQPPSAETKITARIEPAAPPPRPAPEPPPPAPVPEPVGFDLGINLGEAPAAPAGLNLGIALDTGDEPPAPARKPAPAKEPAPTPPPGPPQAKQPPPRPAPEPEEAPLDFGFLGGGGSGGEGPAGGGLDLGIALDFGGESPRAETPAPVKKATPPPTPKPTPVEAAKPIAVAPAPPPAAPALPEFTLNLGGERPAEGGLDLGLNFGAEPARTEAVAPAKKPAAVKPTPPPKPKPVEPPAPEPAPAFALDLGGAAPAEGGFDLGLNFGAETPRTESKPASKKRAPAPAKPAPPPPPPVEATEPIPAFALDLGGEPADAGGLNFGLNFGPEPPLSAAKPAPKKAAPPPPPPQPASDEEEEEEDKDESEEKPRRKIDRRLLIGAGAAALLMVAVGVSYGLGLFGGKAAPGKAVVKGEKKPVKTPKKVVAVSSPKPKPAAGKGSSTPKVLSLEEQPVPEGEGFAVRTRDGKVTREPDLKSAMQRAIGGHGRVLLDNREPVKLTGENATINISGGLLVIGAAPGVRPVLEVEVKGQTPFLSTRAQTPVQLIGVTIVARYTGQDANKEAPPVILAGDSITLDHCAFRAATGAKGSRAVSCEGGALTATGSYFEGFDRSLDFSAYAGYALRASHCIMVRPKAAEGWAVRARNLPGGTGTAVRKVVLEHCTAQGKGFLELADFSPQYPVAVEVKECAVLADALLAWEQPKTEDVPLAPEALHWTGQGNQYDVRGKAWIVLKPEGTTELANGPTDLSSWTKRFTDRDDQPPPVKFATDPGSLSESPQPSDFAVSTDSTFKIGADPARVGPSGQVGK